MNNISGYINIEKTNIPKNAFFYKLRLCFFITPAAPRRTGRDEGYDPAHGSRTRPKSPLTRALFKPKCKHGLLVSISSMARSLAYSFFRSVNGHHRVARRATPVHTVRCMQGRTTIAQELSAPVTTYFKLESQITKQKADGWSSPNTCVKPLNICVRENLERHCLDAYASMCMQGHQM